MRTQPSDALECKVRSPAELAAADREQMYRLMTDHYDNVAWSEFIRDLNEKEWVIVTLDSNRTILGFTTLMRLRAQCRDEQLVALFSGDTVLDADVWGAGGWTRAWGRLAAQIMEDMPGVPLYWLLLTATHRTYRYLTAFFQEYYPRVGVETPVVWRERIEALVRTKFPHGYDASTGIVRTGRPLKVRQERVELSTQGIDDADARFFAERNPGFLQGNYLACIADMSPANRTRFGRRLFSLAP